MSEKDDVAVANDVVATLKTHETFFRRALPAAVCYKIIIRHHFGADKLFLKITLSVDLFKNNIFEIKFCLFFKIKRSKLCSTSFFKIFNILLLILDLS